MPSKEASLQTLPLSVLTPRWGERETQMRHTRLHGTPQPALEGLPPPARLRTRLRPGKNLELPPRPGEAMPPCIPG